MLNDLFAHQAQTASFPGRPTELRAHKNTNQRIQLISGNLVDNSSSVSCGVSARVFDKGMYGFASVAALDAANVAKVMKTAADNAVFLGNKASSKLGELAPLLPGDEAVRHQEKFVAQKLLSDFAKELDSYIAEKYKNLAGRSVMINLLNMEKLLLASNGGEAPIVRSHSLLPRAIVMVGLTAKSAGGAPITLSEALADFKFFTDAFKNPADLHSGIDDLYERVMKKSEGVYCKAGKHQVIIGPSVTGMLAHEAVGHTVEADLVLGGSISGRFMDKQVASELVTMVDFANIKEDGERAHCPIDIDDEGTIAKDALLIDKGILRSYMHNRASAKKLGYEPTGNARAYLFSDEPLIRMRNTAILPGKSKLNDLIASVDDGYYLVKTGNGQADGTSEFMFSITEGYEIKNGKIGSAIKDTTVSGVAFDMLKTVDMVSDDMLWRMSGMCGKKQPIPTANGGPALRCHVNLGGR